MITSFFPQKATVAFAAAILIFSASSFLLKAQAPDLPPPFNINIRWQILIPRL
jgi:hypothetical protein